jgi:hypothetical protein
MKMLTTQGIIELKTLTASSGSSARTSDGAQSIVIIMMAAHTPAGRVNRGTIGPDTIADIQGSLDWRFPEIGLAVYRSQRKPRILPAGKIRMNRRGKSFASAQF